MVESMPLDLDPQLVALFGSETRASVLVALARARYPQTGYRIAKVANIQPIKAYSELGRLLAVGVVRRTSGASGRFTWELPEGAVRTFVVNRARISDWVDWMADPRRRVSSADRRFARRLNAAATGRPPPKSIPPAARAILSEMTRPPEKDRVLELLGLPTSVRRGRR